MDGSGMRQDFPANVKTGKAAAVDAILLTRNKQKRLRIDR